MIVGHPARITRRPNPPSCDGIRAATLDGLLAELDRRAIVSPLFADLTLGAWRSHELARSCFAQLEIEWSLPEPRRPEHRELGSWLAPADADPRQGRAAASAIGDWIDSEGRGDATALAALTLAEQLLGALGNSPLSLAILAPRFDLPWRAENAAFLGYLARGRRDGDRLIVVGDESTDLERGVGLQTRWSDAPTAPLRPRSAGLAALVPGALDPETSRAIGAEGHPLRAGWTLVPIEWRQAPAAAPRLEYDRLAAAAVDGWLRAYAHVHGNNHFVDPWYLCAEANRRLAEGGHEIALQLMERAQACARSAADRAALQALTQGFRIALTRYEEVIAAPDPSPALAPAARGALALTKGWGLVMCGQAERAEPYMHAARELLEPSLGGNRQFLYLLNISALNRVNLGDIDGAMEIEKRIEAASAALEDRDDRLDYVNFINLARLYRRRNEPDLAERYYARAFATTAGARTESDLVYTNVCMARLDAARGRARAAFLAWLRASLYWLASDVPEALGWRVLSAVLGRKTTPAETPVDAVAEALGMHLREAAAAAGIEAPPESGGAPATFVRADRIGRTEGAAAIFGSAQAIGAPGFSVISAPAAMNGAFCGRCQQALAVLVRSLLATVAAAPVLIDFPTIIVNDRLGQEMPITLDELIASCLRHSIGRATFDGDEWELPPARRATLLEKTRVQRGPAVAGVDLIDGGGRVRFRRYLPPLELSLDEARVIAACNGPVMFVELQRRLGCSSDEALRLVRTLESSRAVEVRLELSSRRSSPPPSSPTR